MNFTIFDIDQQISELFDEDTGDVFDTERLDSLMMAREDKVQNIALAYKNICTEVDALQEQEKIFAQKKAAAQKRADRCKKYLQYVLSGEKFKTPLVSVYYSKSKSVVVEDVDKIPEEYRRVVTTIEADKAAIKNAIDAGSIVPGAKIEENQSIVVR